jgi:hypothetical protein
MASVEIEHAGWVGFFRREAGDTKDDFFCGFVGFEFGYLTADTEDLPNVGEIHVVVQFRAGPDLTDLQAAMALIDGLMLRGEKRPGSRPRCLI